MTSKAARIQRKYDAFASSYDRWDAEHRLVGKYRRSLLRPLRGKILEVGVGTGLNLPCYRPNAEVTACDMSGRMLKQAVFRLSEMGEHRTKLMKIDAHNLPFLDGTFDAVVGTFLLVSLQG